MRIERKTAGERGRVCWMGSSALLPIILPSSPPSTVTMDSLAKLREQIQGSGEEWDMDQTRFFMGNNQKLKIVLEGGQR